MNFTKKDLIYLSFFLILLFKNSPEKMSNTDIKKIIQTEYKIDVDAIRNLSKLANDLTSNGKLTVPGGLEIQGEVTMKKGLKITGTLKGQGSNCLDLVGGLNVKFGTVAINRSDNYQALSVNAKGGAYISGKLVVTNATTTGSLGVTNATTTGSLSVKNNSDFGTNSKRQLSIVSSNYKTDQTYLAFFNGGVRTSYIMPQTNGNIFVYGGLDIAKTLHVNGSSILKGNLTAANNKFRIYNNRLGSGELQLIRKNNNRGILITSNYDWKGSHRGGIWTYHDGTRVSKSLY